MFSRVGKSVAALGKEKNLNREQMSLCIQFIACPDNFARPNYWMIEEVSKFEAYKRSFVMRNALSIGLVLQGVFKLTHNLKKYSYDAKISEILPFLKRCNQWLVKNGAKKLLNDELDIERSLKI